MSKSAWEVVQTARDLERPTTQYFLRHIFTDFLEMHGDKAFADDAAIVGGIGFLNGIPVTVIGQEKGVSLSEKARCNFGSAHPEGYRKSLRLMKQAEKFGRPVICIVDTQGAFCGVGAEERGMGEAIARNLLELSRLQVPVISVLIGEGGSGGAIALAISDRVAMLENSVYSILSPEGFSSIIWKEAGRAPEAAELMRMTAAEVHAMGIVDDVIEEPAGGAKANDKGVMGLRVKEYLVRTMDELRKIPVETLLEQRYEKFRDFGRSYIMYAGTEKELQAKKQEPAHKHNPEQDQKTQTSRHAEKVPAAKQKQKGQTANSPHPKKSSKQTKKAKKPAQAADKS